MATITIDTKLQWHIWKDRESGWWVAACDPLKLTASAKRFDDLLTEMRDNVQDVLNSMLRHGELKSFLKDLGWKMQTVQKPAPRSRAYFDVPWEIRRVKNYMGVPVNAS